MKITEGKLRKIIRQVIIENYANYEDDQDPDYFEKEGFNDYGRNSPGYKEAQEKFQNLNLNDDDDVKIKKLEEIKNNYIKYHVHGHVSSEYIFVEELKNEYDIKIKIPEKNKKKDVLDFGNIIETEAYLHDYDSLRHYPQEDLYLVLGYGEQEVESKGAGSSRVRSPVSKQDSNDIEKLVYLLNAERVLHCMTLEKFLKLHSSNFIQ